MTHCQLCTCCAQRMELRKHHHDVMLAIVTSVLRRRLAAAWAAWRGYTLRKRQQKQDLMEVCRLCTAG